MPTSPQVLVRATSSTGTKVYPFDVGENWLVWHLKTAIFGATTVPPTKQSIVLPQNESKELDNSMKLSILFAATPKPLVVMKNKSEEKKMRSNRAKKKGIRPGKRFRESVKSQFCYAAGRGTLRGVAGIPCIMSLQAVSSEFQSLLSKDGRMFSVFIEHSGKTEGPIPEVNFEVDETEMKVIASWVPECSGSFIVSVKVLTNEGAQDIHSSPFGVKIIDHHNSGAEVKKMIHDKEWNVEAAQILADWASKEEFHKIILQDIGMSSILDLLLMKQQVLIHPLMSLALTRLIQKDSTKIAIIKEGGISGLVALQTLQKQSSSPVISRFVSRSFAVLAELVVTFHGTNVQEELNSFQLFQLCNDQFFRMISSLLDHSDIETTRNCSRALATFSSSANYLSLLVEINVYPQIVELFENPDNDVSVRRSALTTLANFTTDKNCCRKYFTDSRISSITKAICHPYTEDMLITNAIRALANLAELEEFSESILSSHFSTVETVLEYTRGTDSQAAWEVGICVQLLPESVDKKDFAKNFGRSLHRDDDFNYESVRLIANLLTNTKEKELVKKLVFACKPTIHNIVSFIKSLNLELQYVSCKTIGFLSEYEAARKEIIHIGGLSALCSALNTCTPQATEHIVAALAQMPLDVKGALVNIIGDSGIGKLIAVLKKTENMTLQKDTAILLASLAGNEDNRNIVHEGGAAFLSNLINLVRKRKVNVETRIGPEELVYDKIVGQGICGIVWKASWKDQTVAVKKFNEDSLAFSLEEFNSEVALMSVLRHENIVHCIGSCAEPENLYIVSELFTKGCVEDLVNDKSFSLTIPMALHLALGAARGMRYLHQLGIIHRDLKNGNLLVGDDWSAKVADFGLSRMMDSKMTRGVGTPIYTAPETLAGSVYSQKADVYSFAFVLWELITREVPFADIPVFDAVMRASDENLRPKIPENSIFEGLIASCWHKNPDMRPTFDEITKVLSQLQLLVGLPPEVSGKTAETSEEDLEEQKYNYSEANDILCATLRSSRKKSSRSRKKDEKRISKQSSQESVPLCSPSHPKRKEKRKSSKGESGYGHERKQSKGKGRIRRSLRDVGLFDSSALIDLSGSSSSVGSEDSSTKESPVAALAKKNSFTESSAPVAPLVNTGHLASSEKTNPVSAQRKPDRSSGRIPDMSIDNTTKCSQCSQIIAGRSIKVGEWAWHIECFICAKCKKSLIQQAWCKYEGNCYCQEDYNKLYAPKCGGCQNILTESYISALNKSWHKECFKCSKCGITLTAFESINGEACCPTCAKK